MKRLILICMILLVNLGISSGPSMGAENASSDHYKVGLDDMLQIKIIDYPDLSQLATVSSDGSITFPYIGTVYVKGMTLSEVEAEITQKLSEGFIKYPVVSVSLYKSMSEKIFVYNEVGKGGEVPFEENLTVMNALSITGGVPQNGTYGIVKIRRQQKGKQGYKDIDVDLKSIIDGNKEADILLQPDDKLIVQRNKSFFVQGEIYRPGEYIIDKDMTVVKALSAANGVTANGLFGKIKIKRKQKEDIEYKDIAVIDINNGTIEGSEGHMSLQPDDILIIERNKTFFVQGEVGRPGEFVLEKGMTIVKAISTAGGVTNSGLYGKIKIKRKEGEGHDYAEIGEANLDKGTIAEGNGGDLLIQPDDILIIERNKTFFVQGEVIRPGEYTLEQDLVLAKVISLAGGVTNNALYGRVKIKRRDNEGLEYKDIAEIHLSKGSLEGGKGGDVSLQADDIVVIERNMTFYVYGEINRPGEYPLENEMTAFKAITTAGGFTKWGSPRRVKILRQSENNIKYEVIKVNINAVLKGDAGADVAIMPGDVLIISEGIF
ncbi:MAG: SLBB domain-containing protein [Nitrospirae bacterium]|nr:SLBB domain-containing protein [Nitrospirota bacterium]